ncbi:hypothetical protein, partial [Streptosporangium sp. NPDC006007]|uniref:hypothetical protein n=1 Tax=Streptosporangium sp. NPDC006007 TaxID=3154575 RepID=UPI0033A58589
MTLAAITQNRSRQKTITVRVAIKQRQYHESTESLIPQSMPPSSILIKKCGRDIGLTTYQALFSQVTSLKDEVFRQ